MAVFCAEEHLDKIKFFECILMILSGRKKLFSGFGPISCPRLFSISVEQGVTAFVWDEIRQANSDKDVLDNLCIDRQLKLRWAINVEHIEQKYAKQKATIAAMAHFFASHGIRMMILKGYGLSLNYPIPKHRQCGDVDIWLFCVEIDASGKSHIVNVQTRADDLLRNELNIKIDEDEHHHTVFYFNGVMVENHYDFLNVHAHISNRIIEKRLQSIVSDGMECVTVDGETVYLPSADFNAVFLLRHMAAHFAAERIGLRHLLDWKYFVEKNYGKIDWSSLIQFSEEMNMRKFLDCVNGICIDYLGMSDQLLPSFELDVDLEKRVLAEIFSPEFTDKKPCNVGLLRSLSYKFRRWWANRWKHRIVYREGLVVTFFVQLCSHLMKPKSLKL